MYDNFFQSCYATLEKELEEIKAIKTKDIKPWSQSLKCWYKPIEYNKRRGDLNAK